jgi:RHS repeat-associated protein
VTRHRHDANGNLVAASDGRRLGYSVRDHSVRASRPGRAPEAMSYHGTGQLERAAAGATSFTNSLLGVTSATTAGVTTRYLRAPDGRVLGQVNPDGASWYFLADALGSVVGVTDAAGAKLTAYGYGPYGEYTYGSDLAFPVHWGFAGEHRDPARPSEPGLYKIGLRYYDPDLGRWTQPDPLERAASPTSAGANPYAYAACDPVNLTDPSGTCAWPVYVSAVLTFVSAVGAVASVPATGPIGVAGAVSLGSSAIGALGSAAMTGYEYSERCMGL